MPSSTAAEGAAGDRLRPEPGPAGAARHRRSRDEQGRTRAARRLLRHASRSCWRSSTTTARCSARRCSTASRARSDVLSLDAGKDFEVVTVSFDPRETPALAAAKKAVYLERYNRPGADRGLALPDRRRAVDQAADEGRRLPLRLGRRTLKQFAHPTGIIVLTPRRAALALPLRHRVRAARSAAGAHRAVGRQDRHRRSISCCSTATTTTPRPASTASRSCASLRIAGVATVLAIGAFIVVMVRREKRVPRPRLSSRTPKV